MVPCVSIIWVKTSANPCPSFRSRTARRSSFTRSRKPRRSCGSITDCRRTASLQEGPLAIIQIIVNGVLLGGLYACIAIGFSIIWGVMNLINLAHGSMIVLGAYITFLISSYTGVDPFLTIPGSAAALFVLGYLLQRFFII